jgi:hypothetical protein
MLTVKRTTREEDKYNKLTQREGGGGKIKRKGKEIKREGKRYTERDKERGERDILREIKREGKEIY